MHYEDEQVIEKALLEVVIYIHIDETSSKGDATLPKLKTEPQLTSIQACRYIRPWKLRKFLNKFPKNFKKELEKMPTERFLLLKFRVDTQQELYLADFEVVNQEDNEFLGLH